MQSCFADHAERLAAFAAADLYPVISSEFCAGRQVTEMFRLIADGGAKIIQLREKSCDKGELYRIACECRKIANRHGVLLIIDDHVDVALACGADGVHLGQSDLSPEVARSLAPELLIGVSTHNAGEIAAANVSGASYLNIGPVFATRTKKVGYPAIGLPQLAELSKLARIPFSVMGGIKAGHLAELHRAGARHIAMVTEITQAQDVKGTVQHLRSLLQSC